MPYKHTQIGYFILSIMLILAIVALVFKLTILFFIAVVAGVFFSTLTVSVQGDGVRLWFGPGFLPMQWSLGDIETCEVTKFRCQSWGIHGRPGKCWIYNVSGFQTVELKMRSGMKYYIGTDQPEKLVDAIHEAIHAFVHRTLKVE